MPDGIDHLQRAMRGLVRLHVLRVDIRGKERRAHSALAQPIQIGMTGGLALADIETVHGVAGHVVVRVDQDGRALHAGDLLIGDLMRRRGDGESGHTCGRKELSKKRGH